MIAMQSANIIIMDRTVFTFPLAPTLSLLRDVVLLAELVYFLFSFLNRESSSWHTQGTERIGDTVRTCTELLCNRDNYIKSLIPRGYHIVTN